MKIDFDNQIGCQNLQIDDDLLESLKEIAIFLLQFSNFEKSEYDFLSIEVILLDSNEMLQINTNYRNENYATDVLSFPLDCDKKILHHLAINNSQETIELGSIIINYNLALEVCDQFKHSIFDEIKILFIHAFLHILGFDHEIDNGKQRELEKQTSEHFHLPLTLISRNQQF